MKKYLSTSFLALSLLLTSVSVFAAENPVTNNATGVTTTEATLNGTNGDSAADNTSFWWGTSAHAPFTPSADPSAQLSDWTYHPTGTGPALPAGTFSYGLAGLTSATDYHYVAWTLVGGTWYPGDIADFTTQAANVAVTGVTMNDATASVEVGSTHQLVASTTPTNATNQNIDWSSANIAVATVDSTGLVTGVTVGTTTITATTEDGGFTAISDITVTPIVPGPPACNSGTFEGFANGSVNGQDGWSATGASYDHEVVSNTYGFSGFGCKTFRISDEVASGSFGDWVFSKSNTNESGETSALNNGFSGGTRQSHFEAEFQIASALQTYQPGMHLSVSPDRGDGGRMSYLRFEDRADGIHVFFDDYSSGVFNETDIATIDRNPHTIKFVMDFVDGPSNDIVKIYIDGNLEITGTSWEQYFVENEGGSSRTVDSLLIQVRGASTPANAGNGFLFDNFNVATSPITTNHTLTYTAGAHGSITGSTTQSVAPGGNGTLVHAIPEANYRFVNWSDGVNTAERTDLNVTGNVNVTANFEALPSGGSTTSNSSGGSGFSGQSSTSGGQVLGASTDQVDNGCRPGSGHLFSASTGRPCVYPIDNGCLPGSGHLFSNETGRLCADLPSTFKFYSDMRIGMNNADVSQLQARLRAEGFFTYPTNTGYFGAITLASVRAYQSAHPEIGFVTGFVGPLTRAVLNR